MNKVRIFWVKINAKLNNIIKYFFRRYYYWLILILGIFAIWYIRMIMYYVLLYLISYSCVAKFFDKMNIVFMGFMIIVSMPILVILVIKKMSNNSEISNYRPYIDVLSDIVNLLTVILVFCKGYSLNIPDIIDLAFEMEEFLSLPYIVFVMKIVAKISLIEFCYEVAMDLFKKGKIIEKVIKKLYKKIDKHGILFIER